MAGQARKDRFLAVLTELGGSAGNGRLRETLQWAEATYNGVKDDLVAEGVVTLGRGRGGSVSLAGTGEIVVKAAPPVAAPAKAAPVKPPRANGNGGNLGFEAELFKAADKLRGNMEPSDYKHVALGLIFLKHISDSFEAKRAGLLADYPDGAEDPDEYSAENVFWVPKEARWSHLQANAKQPSIGKLIDDPVSPLKPTAPDTALVELVGLATRMLDLGTVRHRAFSDLIKQHNKLTDTLRVLRNEAGTVSHGKDGFIAKLSAHHRRSALLAADAIVTFLHEAYLEREPDPVRTFEPYERFEVSNAIIDEFATLRAELDDEGYLRAVVILPDGEEVPLAMKHHACSLALTAKPTSLF